MSGAPILRLHQFLPRSRANGPGLRAVAWVQGCSLGCPGCFNPETHTEAGGERVTVDDLFARIAALGDEIEGVTLSGGEPLQQLEPVTRLLRRIRTETSLSTLMFSGYSWDEIQKLEPGSPPEALGYLDLLIAGRYVATRRLARDLRGSENKQVHYLTGRYTPADLEEVPHAELILTPTGEILFSGIDPIVW